tara:strand:+ start:1860 stop:2405 length:546 start_codon:yes stop_codon:yes gene_type:complete
MLHYKEQSILSNIEFNKVHINGYLRDEDNAFERLKSIQNKVNKYITFILTYLKDSSVDQETYIKLLNERQSLQIEIEECVLQKDEDRINEKLKENSLRLEKDFSSLSEWTDSARAREEGTVKSWETELMDWYYFRMLEDAKKDAIELEEQLRPFYEEIKKYEDRLTKWRALPAMKRLFTDP